MQTFTVVLLYPDWIDTGDGDPGYVDVVTAQDATQAIAKARNNAQEANLEVDDGEDFTVLAVVPGEPDQSWL